MSCLFREYLHVKPGNYGIKKAVAQREKPCADALSRETEGYGRGARPRSEECLLFRRLSGVVFGRGYDRLRLALVDSRSGFLQVTLHELDALFDIMVPQGDEDFPMDVHRRNGLGLTRDPLRPSCDRDGCAKGCPDSWQ